MKTVKKLLATIVGLSLVIVVLSGCLSKPRDEKQAFVDATIEATCYIFKQENVFDPKVEEEAKKIYGNYGFDVENETEMEAIAKKYSEDQDVQNSIVEGIKECSPDSFGLGDTGENLVPEGTTGDTVEGDTGGTPADTGEAPAADTGEAAAADTAETVK